MYKLIALLLSLTFYANAALQYKLVERTEFDINIPNDYQFYLTQKNMPCKALITVKTLDGKYKKDLVEVDEEGILWYGNKKYAMNFNCGYGVEFEVIVAALKGDEIKPLGKCTITPNPLIVFGDTDEKLEIKPLDSSGLIFSIRGFGFPPNKTLKYISQSCHEILQSEVRTNDKGELCIMSFPAVNWKICGPLKISVEGYNEKNVTISHFWGEIAFALPKDYSLIQEKYPF